MVSIEKAERAINQQHYWSIKSWSDWCHKNGCELVVLDQEILNPPQWNKLKIFDLLEASKIDYDRILYVDADTLVHPNMPNIFEETESGYFYGVRNYGSMDWVIRSIENYSHHVFHGHKLEWEKYINTGVMLFDKSHKDFFDAICQFNEELGVGKDQPVINFMLDINDIPRKFLPYEYNAQDLNRFETFNNGLFMENGIQIAHFNCGIKPTVGHAVQHFYKVWKKRCENEL